MSTAGAQHELARYELPDGTTRALCRPAHQRPRRHQRRPHHATQGRVYLVERHIESQAAMRRPRRRLRRGLHRRGEPAVLVPTATGLRASPTSNHASGVTCCFRPAAKDHEIAAATASTYTAVNRRITEGRARLRRA